ncbi:hypothetical protein ABKN59_008945 [Abortiporus biennis]
MPRPNSKDTPQFKGRHVEDFIKEIEELACNVNVAEALLPNWALHYSTDKVKSTLCYLPAFKSGKDWDAAKETLCNLYQSKDIKRHFNEKDLHSFCKKSDARDHFKSRTEVDTYVHKFT